MNVSKAIFVRDIKLASALATMGCHPTSKPIERIVTGGAEQCFFHFEDDMQTRDFVAAWESTADTWKPSAPDARLSHALQNPEHPFWYIRTALRNRERYLDAVKQRSVIHMVERDGRTYLISKPAQ